MMQGWRIFKHVKFHVVARSADSRRFCPIDADFFAGFDTVLQSTGLESGVGPRFRDQSRTRSWSDRFRPLSEPPMILRGEKTMLDRQLPHGNLQNLVVSYFFHHRRRFVMGVSTGLSMRMCMAHRFSSLVCVRLVFCRFEPSMRALCL